MAYEDNGRESEWNEASLKSLRLHEVQSALNFFKSDPNGTTLGKFNYEWLIRCLDNLYGEGRSKYSQKERDRIDRIKLLLFNSLKLLPPHKKVICTSFSHTGSEYKFNPENFENIMLLVDLFETEVKDSNDKHGLTTKNKDYDDLF